MPSSSRASPRRVLDPEDEETTFLWNMGTSHPVYSVTSLDSQVPNYFLFNISHMQFIHIKNKSRSLLCIVENMDQKAYLLYKYSEVGFQAVVSIELCWQSYWCLYFFNNCFGFVQIRWCSFSSSSSGHQRTKQFYNSHRSQNISVSCTLLWSSFALISWLIDSVLQKKT